MTAFGECQSGWLEPGGEAAARTIIEFLHGIGISVRESALPVDTFLPKMNVVKGAIVVDPSRAGWPGDLLHEAGHIAVMNPAVRLTGKVTDDPAEEMTAIAWSVAAAEACGIALNILFHPEGYKGASESHIANFSQGRRFGVPMLQYWGMSAERAGNHGLAVFPAMSKWLRS